MSERARIEARAERIRFALSDVKAPGDLDAGQLAALADRVMVRVLPETPCRRGCSHCCRQAVPLPESAARRLSAATGRPLRDGAGSPVDADKLAEMNANPERFKGSPCPFLDVDAGECTTYAARPIQCRTHHSLADTSDYCDTSKPQSYPAFDLSWLELIAVAAAFDEPWADIREWFP